MASALQSQPARVALAHDWLVGYRGGEGVLDCLARMVRGEYRAGGLYTLFDDGRALTPAIDDVVHRVSALNRVPMAKRARRWLLPVYHIGVAHLSSMLAADDGRTGPLVDGARGPVPAVRRGPGAVQKDGSRHGGGDAGGASAGRGRERFAA